MAQCLGWNQPQTAATPSPAQGLTSSRTWGKSNRAAHHTFAAKYQRLEILIHAKLFFFSALVNSGCSVCNSVAALKMSSCVRLGTNFNYRRPLFVPPRQSSSFQRALSSFYHCLYNIPCLSQTRRPIIEMISSPSNVHHDKHDSSDRIYSSLFIHRSMAWLGWRNMYWSGAL